MKAHQKKKKKKALSADKSRVNFTDVGATYQTRETHNEMFRAEQEAILQELRLHGDTSRRAS